MWQSIRMPSGRWFVVRYKRGRSAVLREFYKQGPSSVPFNTEQGAVAQATKLNTPLAGG